MAFQKVNKKKKDEIYALTAFLFRNLTKLYGYQEQEETEEKKLMLKEVLFFCGWKWNRKEQAVIPRSNGLKIDIQF